jgi:hypothetical protein
VNCWSCQAENDLNVTQTCLHCGAPLVKTWSVFRKSVLAAVVLGLIAFQMVCVLGHAITR